MNAENCRPPLGVGEEVVSYLSALTEGERVVECGQSGMTGRLGTVYISTHSGEPVVCVRWDVVEGEGGQMSTSATWGTRRLADAGTFAHRDDREGPYESDGCDKDGFLGGCVRMGHTPENCPGFQIGDTVRFNANHLADGDTGVIVGEEVWLNPNDTIPWDGVGERPVYNPGDFPNLLAPEASRFLVRLLTFGKPEAESNEHVNGWRRRCRTWPHSYPFVTPRDIDLVSRPKIAVLNDSGCHGSALGYDKVSEISCISDSAAGARKAFSQMLASKGAPLIYPPRPPGEPSKILNFRCEETLETKVADTVEVGFKFFMSTMFGVRIAEVEAVDLEAGTADTMIGGLTGILKRKDDGWYDQHITINAAAIQRVQFTP